jgi:hypothetical protein
MMVSLYRRGVAATYLFPLRNAGTQEGLIRRERIVSCLPGLLPSLEDGVVGAPSGTESWA